MKRGRGGVLRILLVAAILVVAGFSAVLFLFPAAALKAQFEAQISKTTGYAVTTRTLGLGLSGFNLALKVRDLRAESADLSRTITIRDLDVEVALPPLFRKEIEVRKLSGKGGVLMLESPTGVETAAAAPGGGRDGGAIVAPEIVLTDSRIIQTGAAGVTTLHGVALRASFRSAAGGGRLDGRFRADSTSFVPGVAPDTRLVLPPLDLAFGSDVTGTPISVRTRVEGTLGSWPLHGGIQSTTVADGMENIGDLEFDPVSIAALRDFLPGDVAGTIGAYELGGSLENGRLHFETLPGRDETEYLFTARWTGVRAALPEKGRVVDDGTLELDLRPDNLTAGGDLVLGASNINVKANVRDFARPAWTADVRVRGPAADALSFLPPDADWNVTSGHLDVDLRLSGPAGRTGLPQASGTMRMSAMAFTHTALSAPVERLDLSMQLAGTSLTIESGSVLAAGSDARFRGTVADFRKPDLKLDVIAGTLDLGRLFPEVRPAASLSAPKGQARKGAGVPASGRITIDRLVRDRLTLTGVTAEFVVTERGVDLTGISGKAYGGDAKGELHLKPSGPEQWAYEGDFLLDQVRAGDFLAALTPIKGLEGTLRTGFRVAGVNGPGLDPLQSLSMRGAGIVFDGALANIPAVRKLAAALNLKEGAGASLPFKTIRHRFRVEDGFVIMDSMSVAQASGDWRVGGRIGFDGSLDCPIATNLSPEMFAAGTDLRKLADLLADSEGRLPLNLRLSGSLKAPEVFVDVDPLVQAAKDRAKESLGDEIRKRLGGILKKK